MKAILLVRVSTQKQDFDAQESELYNLAINGKSSVSCPLKPSDSALLC